MKDRSSSNCFCAISRRSRARRSSSCRRHGCPERFRRHHPRRGRRCHGPKQRRTPASARFTSVKGLRRGRRDVHPTGAQRDQAAAIFAGFDTLIQNPDRRAQNPNSVGHAPIVWGFTITSRRSPFSSCRLSLARHGRVEIPSIRRQDSRFWRINHIFYGSLRGGEVRPRPFLRSGSAIYPTPNSRNTSTPCRPRGAREGNDLCEQIPVYLREARQERKKLIGFVKHILRCRKHHTASSLLRYVHATW